MMYTSRSKLDKSCSESDLYKVNFDNLTLQDYPSIGIEKRIPFVGNRVLIVEEIIHNSHEGSSRLRSSSCGQSIPDHLHNLQSVFSTSLVLNNSFNECDLSTVSLTTQSNPNVLKIESTGNCMKNESVMPMDVDILNDSLKLDKCGGFVEMMDMETDSNNFTSGRLNNLDSVLLKKRYSVQKPEKTSPHKSVIITNKTNIVPITLQKKESRTNNFVLILSVCFVLFLLYVFFIQEISFMSVNSDIQLKNIHKDLLEKIHKQKTSVNVVVQSLELRKYWKSKIKVLGFIGPTGVGKTFAANIIKKHFHQGLIHELYGIQLSYKSQWENILTALKKCCFNLIIIDDLKRKDITDLFALIHSLPQDQYILVISIFNTQYYDGKEYTSSTNDVTEISNEFDNSGFYHDLVIFQEFKTDEVKDWIKKQLKLKNIEHGLQEKILKTVLDGHVVQNQGLKGLYSKILLELEKYKR